MDEFAWTFIDEIERRSLRHLDDSDLCYYYLVRIPGGYSASEANNRIDNFKKEPERFRNNPTVWGYKQSEIKRFAADVQRFLEQSFFRNAISQFEVVSISPMPTSKPRSHKDFDPRLEQLCQIVSDGNEQVQYMNLFDMREETVPSHKQGSRDVEFLESRIILTASRLPDLVILVDDVLTSGAHFAACRNLIRKAAPAAPIIGLFLARHRGNMEPVQYVVTEF